MTETVRVANRKVYLKPWEGHGKKRIYLNSYPADGSKAVGRSYDWGYVDAEGHHGDDSRWRYEKYADEAGFAAMLEKAQELLGQEVEPTLTERAVEIVKAAGGRMKLADLLEGLGGGVTEGDLDKARVFYTSLLLTGIEDRKFVRVRKQI